MRTSKDGESLLDFITLHGAKQLAHSLTLIHDWILYDSDIPIDKGKKDTLHDVKLLAKKVRKLKKD